VKTGIYENGMKWIPNPAFVKLRLGRQVGNDNDVFVFYFPQPCKPLKRLMLFLCSTPLAEASG
jgi:hypothetical protein